ncbi:magnesium/cobalt transporter CorA [bacterium]|nr:magnesium/cobalt transporter CorA [bacterium]
MSKFTKKRSKKRGLSPGTLIHIGEQKLENVKISVLDYDENSLLEKEILNVNDCLAFKNKKSVTWLNVDGIHKVEIIKTIGEIFGMHTLVLEDVLNTDQRPKTDIFKDFVFVVLKMIDYNNETNEVETEQLSLVLGENFVLTFQENSKDIFDPLRKRIRTATGKIRKSGSDYLAYAILDAIVDNYFLVLEKLGEKIELTEDELLKNPTPQTLHTIQTLKKEMIFLRKAVYPLREVLVSLERGDSTLFTNTTELYLRDVYDHTIQVIDTVETFREFLSGMLEVYLSSLSNKMNNVMKTLTLMTALFMPLGLVAGIYGMNFKKMPELEWKFGYPFALFLMGLISVSMLAFMKKKKWF